MYIEISEIEKDISKFKKNVESIDELRNRLAQDLEGLSRQEQQIIDLHSLIKDEIVSLKKELNILINHSIELREFNDTTSKEIISLQGSSNIVVEGIRSVTQNLENDKIQILKSIESSTREIKENKALIEKIHNVSCVTSSEINNLAVKIDKVSDKFRKLIILAGSMFTLAIIVIGFILFR